jgi:ABC-2 type transport system permease protein
MREVARVAPRRRVAFGPYRSYFAARFRALLQYRAAAIGGVVTQVFFGYIQVMVFEAFYRSTTVTQPMSIAQVVTYIWLGQAFLSIIPWYVEGEQRAMIRSGAVAYELLRPINLYTLWFARAVACRTAPTLLRCVPIVLLSFAFFGLALPASPAAGLAWAAAMLGAVLLSAAITTLLTTTLLWTVSGEGINVLVAAIVTLCSGLMIPLPLFPAWARRIVEVLPFRGLMDTPFRLYVGYAPPGDVLGLLAQQVAWTAVLMVAGGLLLRRGLRRLAIMGG